jgi:sugar lactone lactonase YvrE
MRNLILLLTVLCAVAPQSQSQTAASPGTVITIAGNGTIGFSGDGGPATNASFNVVDGLAYGPDGTLYIADGENVRVRAVDPVTGNIRTIAGTGTPGDEGNGGPATSANLSGVIGLATDHARNALYVTDWANNWIRKVNLTDGIITAYAGSGAYGFSGDGGPATQAKLVFPLSAATDGLGRLSFVDTHNDRVRRVDPVTGIITTIAGSGIGAPPSGPTGDGGPATSATFGSAMRLGADPAGNVYLRDGDPNGQYFTVRKIDATTGIITTIVGGGSNPPGTGLATSMLFDSISEVAANDAGELFVATPYRVFKLNIATGIIAPFAGDGTRGLGNEGDPALTAKFNNITSLALAPDGGLAIADSDNARIRLVTPQPKQPPTSSDRVIAIAGNGTVGFSGDGGPALDASLNSVAGLAFGRDGTLYISDSGNFRIRALDPITGRIRTIAGTGTAGDEGNGGPATSANLATVIGLATDHSRNALYFSEYGNFWARKINLTDGIISLYAGTGVPGPGGDGGLATATRLRRPISAATDAFGKFYFSDYVSSRVRSVDPVTGIITTIAGTGTSGVPSGDGGPGTSATIGSPMRLTADPAGNVYLRDGDPNGTYFMVRRIDATTGIINTIVGGGTNAPGTGLATAMFFDNIGEVAANGDSELFVATPIQVFKLNIATGIIAPYAGDGISGATTNGIPALTARFFNITALAAAPGGGLVIADQGSSRVYHIRPDKPPAASSGTIITIAGRGIGYAGDGGPATNALVSDGVIAMDFGPDGTLYFADIGNARIRAVDPVTGIIRTVAGNGNLVGQDQDVGDGGPATNAPLGPILGLAVDRTRNVLYLSDGGNNRIRKVDLATGIISRSAGKGLFNGYGGQGDGGPAVDASFAEPRGIGIGAGGRLLIADQLNGRIRQVNPVTGTITTLAGVGDIFNQPCIDAGNGGPATSAFFGLPTFVSEDAFGNVYVLDGGSACPTVNFVALRRIDAVTGIITRVAGGGANVPGHGPATEMNLQGLEAHPAIDAAGDVYIASSKQVFTLSVSTGLLSVFAGDGVAGDQGYGDGGPASQARFGAIAGLAAAPGGGLVISDSGNGRIRFVAPESVSLVGDSGQTSFTLPWVKELSGDLVLENNTNLTTINLAALTSVSGNLVLGGNTAAGDLDLGSLESADTVSVTGNTAAGNLDLGSLETTSGDLIITDNTATTVINLASLTTVSGDLTIGNNGASGNLDLGSLETVSGDLTLEEPTSGNLDLGSLEEVSGDLTLESNESGNLDISTLTEYGCVATNEVTMTLDGSFAMTNGITLCTNATLAGSATVDGSVTNNGTIEPGSSPGRLSITRNLHLGPTSRLNLEIGGYAPTEIDTVIVGGNVVLGGTLTIRLLNTFTNVMTNGASFTVMTSAQPLTGAFANVASGATLTTADGLGRFTVRYAGENTVRLTDLEILTITPDLRVVASRPQSGVIRIAWNAIGGESYRVESTASLDSAFTDESAIIPAPGVGELTLHHDMSFQAGETARFYRVRVLP